jgi:hypothetical protein
VECDKAKSAIEINIDTGIALMVSDKNGCPFTEDVCVLSPVDDVETQLLNDKANIKEIAALDKLDSEEELLNELIAGHEPTVTVDDEDIVDVEATVVEVTESAGIPETDNNNSIVDINDIEINAEAFEAASNFIKTVDRFKDAEDLAEKIELDNVEVLSYLGPHALGNRIMSYVGKVAFYKGWLLGKKVQKPEDSTDNTTDNIRNLKKITMNLAKMLDKAEMSETAHTDLIRTGANLLLLDKNMVKVIGNLFSRGDTRNSVTLKKLVTFSQKIGE